MTNPYQPFSGRVTFPGSPPVVLLPTSHDPLITAMVIPLDNTPNNTITVTVQVDGLSLDLQLTFRYNTKAGYWALTIADPITGNILIDSVPLVTGQYPAANLLGQYAYLGIGSAYLVPMGGSPLDYPDNLSLGSYFVLVWGDTDISDVSAPIVQPSGGSNTVAVLFTVAPVVDESGNVITDESGTADIEASQTET